MSPFSARTGVGIKRFEFKKKELSQRTKKAVRKNELSVLAGVGKATFTMGATEFAWFPVSVASVFDIRDKKPLVSRLSKTPV